MKNIRSKITMLATLAGILSLSMGFMPQSEAGSIAMTLDFGAPVCGVSIPGAALGLVGGPTIFTTNFDLQNNGNGVQDVQANIGNGWFGSEGSPVLHLDSDTTDLSSSDTGGPLGDIGPVAMDNAGADKLIAELVGQGGPSTIDISVDATTPINPPFSGVQSTTLFLTAAVGGCHA